MENSNINKYSNIHVSREEYYEFIEYLFFDKSETKINDLHNIEELKMNVCDEIDYRKNINKIRNFGYSDNSIIIDVYNDIKYFNSSCFWKFREVDILREEIIKWMEENYNIIKT